MWILFLQTQQSSRHFIMVCVCFSQFQSFPIGTPKAVHQIWEMKALQESLSPSGEIWEWSANVYISKLVSLALLFCVVETSKLKTQNMQRGSLSINLVNWDAQKASTNNLWTRDRENLVLYVQIFMEINLWTSLAIRTKSYSL